MISVMNECRTAMTNLLANATLGFNTTLATYTEAFGALPFTISYEQPSNNFFQGWYSVKDLLETSAVRFPIQCVYGVKSQNENFNKFVPFSGRVTMGLDTYLTYKKSAALSDAESLGDAVESTLYAVFNSQATYHYLASVGWDGQLLITKGPLSTGASNWLQLLSARLTFEVNAQ